MGIGSVRNLTNLVTLERLRPDILSGGFPFAHQSDFARLESGRVALKLANR